MLLYAAAASRWADLWQAATFRDSRVEPLVFAFCTPRYATISPQPIRWHGSNRVDYQVLSMLTAISMSPQIVASQRTDSKPEPDKFRMHLPVTKSGTCPSNRSASVAVGSGVFDQTDSFDVEGFARSGER